MPSRPIGLCVEELGDVVGGDEDVGEAEHDQRAALRARRSAAAWPRDDDARAFAADQRAGHVEAVFGQQLVEVVAGDAARDAGKLLADEVGVAIANALQSGVDLAPCGRRRR